MGSSLRETLRRCEDKSKERKKAGGLKKKRDKHAKNLRLNELEVFLPSLGDKVTAKADGPALHHPLFVLGKKPDLSTRTFFDEKGNITYKVNPSVLGHATIYDKAVLIYAMSHLIRSIDKGQLVGRRVKIDYYPFARATK